MTQQDKTSTTPQPKGQPLRAVIIFIIITLTILAADLVSKSIAFSKLPDNPVALTSQNATEHTLFAHEPFTVIPKILNLHLTTNTGAVFGLGKGSQLFFIVVSFFAVGLVGWFFWSSPRKAIVNQISLAMILGGALGNLYDRIRFNAVRDLLHLFPGVKLPFGLHWPGGSEELYPWIFNIADVGLVVGVIALIIVSWKTASPPQPDDQKDPD